MARIPPLISYTNVLTDAVLTATAETDDGAAANCTDGLTYDYWVPGEPASIEFQLAEPETVECFGVAAHTLSSSGVSIKLEHWDGAAWVEISRPHISYVDVTIFDYFEPVTSDLFRVSVTGSCAVGVVWAGPVLHMERNLYQGHTPITMAENRSQRVNVTELGELRGVAVTEKGARLNADFKNLSASWVRSEFAPFVDSFNAGKPFFWAWYYDKFPTEVAYCWGGGGLSVTNSGPRDLMSTSISANAYLDGPNGIPLVVTTTPYFVYELQSLSVQGASALSGDIRLLPFGYGSDYADISGSSVISMSVYDIVKYGYDHSEVDVFGASVEMITVASPVKEIDDQQEVDVSGANILSASVDEIVVTHTVYDPDEINVSGATIVSGSIT